MTHEEGLARLREVVNKAVFERYEESIRANGVTDPTADFIVHAIAALPPEVLLAVAGCGEAWETAAFTLRFAAPLIVEPYGQTKVMEALAAMTAAESRPSRDGEGE